MATGQYSTVKISQELLSEILDALKNIRGYGSVEIYVQNSEVVQITERNIKKTAKQEQSHTQAQK